MPQTSSYMCFNVSITSLSKSVKYITNEETNGKSEIVLKYTSLLFTSNIWKIQPIYLNVKNVRTALF